MAGHRKDLGARKHFRVTAGGEVMRICALVWRRGELIGARFVTAKELRQGLGPDEADRKPQQMLVD